MCKLSLVELLTDTNVSQFHSSDKESLNAPGGLFKSVSHDIKAGIKGSNAVYASCSRLVSLGIWTQFRLTPRIVPSGC